MKTETIIVEGESLDEARQKLKALIPEGLVLHKETILSDVRRITDTAPALTNDEITTKIPDRMPENANILERKVSSEPQTITLILEAPDRASLQALVDQKAKERSWYTEVKDITLIKPGSQGFLGLGKRLDQYRVILYVPTILTITYQTRARISAVIGEKRLEDYTLEDWIPRLTQMPIATIEQRNNLNLPYGEPAETDDPREIAQLLIAHIKQIDSLEDIIWWTERVSKTETTYCIYRTGEHSWAYIIDLEFLD